jgi:hypothetical protein
MLNKKSRTLILPLKYRKVVLSSCLALERFHALTAWWGDVPQHVRHLWIGDPFLSVIGSPAREVAHPVDTLALARMRVKVIVERCARLQSLGVGQKLGTDIVWRTASTSIMDLTSNSTELWLIRGQPGVADQQSPKRLYIDGVNSPFKILEAMPHLELYEGYDILRLPVSGISVFLQRYLLVEEESQSPESRHRARDGRVYTVQSLWAHLPDTSRSILFDDWEARIQDPRLWPKDNSLAWR